MKKKTGSIKKFPGHDDQMVALKRIEGQVRGVRKMISDRKYCVDILIQLQATIGAISTVANKILKKHIEGCVVNAFKGRSSLEKQRKIDEVMNILTKFRKA